ncbi:MAG: M14 family metallopeptidase [Pyrinomonadaceae bacterium]
MKLSSISFASLRLCGIFLLLSIGATAQIPAPKDTLGFTPGDDRKLASWAQVVDYFKKLDAASDRMIFEEIYKSTMGAPFVYATISAPKNLKNLEKYKQINAKLADPRKIGGAGTLLSARGDSRKKAAQKLIAQGKTIVLITCGIHSTEVGSTLSSMLIAHRLASSNEREIKKILENTIILLVPSLNPDGVDIVKNWYDKTRGTPYEGTEPPELYHKYVGHDNNRDWYAFTQVETQLTVDKIHNVWHPQIVHDIHQQGQNGARLFLPPYMQPVEPNVPKQIVEGYTELGTWMANDLRKKGLEGITTNTTYDAWTPARAYSHYHGGVRILSETASAKLATPINVKFEDLRGASGGLDAKKESTNFGPVWKGGEWKLRNITDYMTTAAFSLLGHAADNRERWLSRFYVIGKEAVRPRKEGEVAAYLLDYRGNFTFFLQNALEAAGVEVSLTKEFTLNGKTFPITPLIRLDQPYGAFVKAMLENQVYPDLRTADGQPIQPYDVTSHNLALLTNTPVVKILSPSRMPELLPSLKPEGEGGGMITIARPEPPKANLRLYKSHRASMDEGWTRWIFDDGGAAIFLVPEALWKDKLFRRVNYKTILDNEIRKGNFEGDRFIVFPDQAPNQILTGYSKDSMPDEYTGGVGNQGVENLRKFVEGGGTLVFLNRASNFAIEQFKLPVKDVTRGLNRKDFYIPGSILRTELDITHPIAKGMPKGSIAWFENSPVFEIITDPLAAGPTRNFRIIANYPKDPKQILLSGWALGAEKIAGKAALVEFTIGKGKIILFGFRPQYRGQSLATFPLLFNAISK